MGCGGYALQHVMQQLEAMTRYKQILIALRHMLYEKETGNIVRFLHNTCFKYINVEIKHCMFLLAVEEWRAKNNQDVSEE